MTQYRVTGTAVITESLVVDRILEADSGEEAQRKAILGVKGIRWSSGPDVQAIYSLAEIERLALADWNAQRPTSSPLALAQARGEI